MTGEEVPSKLLGDERGEQKWARNYGEHGEPSWEVGRLCAGDRGSVSFRE